jgi:sulfofructose kinase
MANPTGRSVNKGKAKVKPAIIRAVRLPALAPATTRSLDVLAVGENSLDTVTLIAQYPAAGSKHLVTQLRRLPGGQTATAAAALATLGWRTEYIGWFGDDLGASVGLESLKAAGVRCDRPRVIPGASSREAIVIVDASGERTVLAHQDPAGRLQPEDVPPDRIDAARVVLLDDSGPAAQAVARAARLAGARVVIDIDRERPGLIDLLRDVDVVIVATGVTAALTGVADPAAALEALQALTGAPVVCETRGAAGSLAWAGGHVAATPAFDMPVVDTTGAGDLFRAGFIAGWLAGGDAATLEAALRYANAVAALACRGLGARGSLPSAADVDALLRRPASSA